MCKQPTNQRPPQLEPKETPTIDTTPDPTDAELDKAIEASLPNWKDPSHEDSRHPRHRPKRRK